jgi:hypothetical protein
MDFHVWLSSFGMPRGGTARDAIKDVPFYSIAKPAREGEPRRGMT